jgi:hypothetical protein
MEGSNKARKQGGKEGRKEGRKERRKEGKKEVRCQCMFWFANCTIFILISITLFHPFFKINFRLPMGM